MKDIVTDYQPNEPLPPGVPNEVDFFDDRPGDTRVRPGTGRPRDFIEEERIRRALYQKWLKENQGSEEEKKDEIPPSQTLGKSS